MTDHYTSINEHTGAMLKSRPNTKAYEDNYDRIFGKALCPVCKKEVDKNDPTSLWVGSSWWHEGCWEWNAINLENMVAGGK